MQKTTMLSLQTPQETQIFSTTLQDIERRPSTDDPTYGRSRIVEQMFSPGSYQFSIELLGNTTSLIEWNDINNIYVPECIIQNNDDQSMVRTLPMWEKNWGSLQSEVIPITDCKTCSSHLNIESKSVVPCMGK